MVAHQSIGMQDEPTAEKQRHFNAADRDDLGCCHFGSKT
jgi:hypothetical protein